jgi:hypothetical protein
MAGRARRRARRALVVACALVGVAAIGSIPLYVFPGDQTPRKADVVFVIGPPTDGRVAYALDLIERGYAGALMISTILPDAAPPVDTGWAKPPLPSWARSGDSTARAQALCAEGHPSVPLTCLQPEPFTTEGEARALRDAMDENGWTTAIVVTVTPHVNRARFIFGRCVASGVQVLGIADGLDLGGWAWQYAYQTGGWVKAIVTSTC